MTGETYVLPWYNCDKRSAGRGAVTVDNHTPIVCCPSVIFGDVAIDVSTTVAPYHNGRILSDADSSGTPGKTDQTDNNKQYS